MKGSIETHSQQQRMLRTLCQEGQSQNQQEFQQEQKIENKQLILSQLPIFLMKKNRKVQQSENMTNDISKCKDLLEILRKSQFQSKRQIESIIQYFQNEDIVFNKGIQFYNCKNLIFLQYMTLLEFYKLFRINLVSFKQKEDTKMGKEDQDGELSKSSQKIGHQLYKKLIFYNSLLLKLTPLEKKLDYQTTKMLRAVQSNDLSKIKVQVQVQNKNSNQKHIKESKQKKQSIKKMVTQTVDALSHRARLDNLLPVHEEKAKNRDSSRVVIQKTSDKKYVPPKLSAVLPKQQKSKIREQRNQERLKAHLTHRLMDDLKGFSQGNGANNERAIQQSLNDDILNSSSAGIKLPKRFIQKQRYQEQYWTRLPDTKQDKKLKKQLRKQLKRGNVNQLNQQLKQVQLMRNLVTKVMKKQ